jgi:hypothetical protein
MKKLIILILLCAGILLNHSSVIAPLVYMIAYPLVALFVFLLFTAVGGVSLARRRRVHI